MDGLGWLLDKTFRLMATYDLTEDYVLDELDGAKGWAMYNWSIANEANVWGTGLKIKGDGYIQQEKKRLAKLKN